MRAASPRLWLVAIAVAFWACGAMAHVTSTAVAVLDVSANRLTYRLTLAVAEQEEEFGRLLQGAARGESEALGKVTQATRDYARFALDGADCLAGNVAVQAAGDGKVALEMTVTCPKATGTLWIRDDWLEAMDGHSQTVLSVVVRGRRVAEFVFVEDRRTASLDLSAAASDGWAGFVAMGAEHILGGPDHLLFLLALLAMTRGVWPIVKIVTAFTVAHSISLGLAALGVVTVPPRVVEPLIAATIVWVAVENIAFPGSGRRRWLAAAIFGLIHGLGFAGALVELGLPRDAMVRALVGFNAGVELGQLAFVAVAMPAVIWLSRPGRVEKLPQLLSGVVAMAGLFWMGERLFFA